MKYLCEKYKDENFSVFGQYAYDVAEGEKLSNKDIAA